MLYLIFYKSRFCVLITFNNNFQFDMENLNYAFDFKEIVQNTFSLKYDILSRKFQYVLSKEAASIRYNHLSFIKKKYHAAAC